MASKAVFKEKGRSVIGVLILTDKRIYFGSVNRDVSIEIRVQNISDLIVEKIPKSWPDDINCECEQLCITEKKQYAFELKDPAFWIKTIILSPAAHEVCQKIISRS
ncbi:MAG: hypothetical protein KDI30_00120 [Pseudomonadales bacterium]|nr:hypothetical protein [Pseudomonadales bacterium]